MKPLRALLLAVLPLSLMAQVSVPKALTNQKGTLAQIPANCSVGQLYFASDQTPGANVYGCTAGNVWTLTGSGPAGPTGPTGPTGATGTASAAPYTLCASRLLNFIPVVHLPLPPRPMDKGNTLICLRCQ